MGVDHNVYTQNIRISRAAETRLLICHNKIRNRLIADTLWTERAYPIIVINEFIKKINFLRTLNADRSVPEISTV